MYEQRVRDTKKRDMKLERELQQKKERQNVCKRYKEKEKREKCNRSKKENVFEREREREKE